MYQAYYQVPVGGSNDLRFYRIYRYLEYSTTVEILMNDTTAYACGNFQDHKLQVSALCDGLINSDHTVTF